MAFQRYVGLSVTTKDGESVKIEDLRIDFDIERTCGKEANRAVIRVYNQHHRKEDDPSAQAFPCPFLFQK